LGKNAIFAVTIIEIRPFLNGWQGQHLRGVAVPLKTNNDAVAISWMNSKAGKIVPDPSAAGN
jgi:hypothetical protein